MSFMSFLRINAPWLSSGVLLAFLSSFGQTFFISIFAGDIRETFGLSHGAWGGLYAAGTTASAIAMIWAGALTDRIRARDLGALVLGCLGLSCLFMAVNPSWILLPLVIFCLRFSGQGMAMHIALVSMTRWFVAARGRALSIAGLGLAMGEALLPIVFVAALTVLDWRMLWIVSAAVAFAGIPLLRNLLMTERKPRSMDKDVQSRGMNDVSWTRTAVYTHWLFWFMVPALLGPSAFGTAFFFHQVHFAQIKGFTHLDLVTLFPVYTGTAGGAMVASGWLLDRFGTPRLIPWFQVPLIVAFTFYGMGQTLEWTLAGMVMMGLTTGAGATLPNAFWAEFYGTRNLGAIKALAAAIMGLGSALGPGVTGVGRDLGISLETQFLAVSGFFCVTTAMMVIGVSRAKRLLPV